MNYYAVKNYVKGFIEQNKKGNIFENQKPYIPFHLQNLINREKGTKIFYRSFIDTMPIVGTLFIDVGNIYCFGWGSADIDM